MKVSGRVLLDGQPLKGASVHFLPEEKEGGNPAFGTTDDSGQFKLTTFSTNDGAIPGEYKVTVEYAEIPSLPEIPEGKGGKTMAPMEQRMKQVELASRGQRGKKKEGPKVDPKFSSPTKTPLREKVPPNQPIVIEVTSKK